MQLAKQMGISYCKALQMMYANARAFGDFKLARAIQQQQKTDGCRHRG